MQSRLRHVASVAVCAVVFAGCANESLAGLALNERAFTGSYLAPSQALTAGVRATSAVPTAAASEVFSEEEIRALANKTLQINDDWVGPICEGYKKYYAHYMKLLDYNIDSAKGGSRMTTGDPAVKTALKMARDLKPLAKNKEQKEWAAYAEKFLVLVDSGKPQPWTAGDPDGEVDWLAEGWTKDPTYGWNQPLADLGPYQAAMAACLKLK